MPFTLAHPSLVVPLKKPLKKWGVLSALVIGSMTPDFSYFLPLGVTRSESHTLFALLWFCLPVGLGLFYLYHTLFAPFWLSISPRGIQQRIDNKILQGALPNASISAIIISILIGATSHITWDLFTHPPHQLPSFLADWMNSVAIQFGLFNYYTFQLLQTLSSLIGLSLLFYWLVQWYRKTPATHHVLSIPSRSYIKTTRIIFVLFPILVGLFYAYLSAKHLSTLPHLSSSFKAILAFRDFIIFGGRYLLLIWTLLGISFFIIRMRFYKHRSANL